MSVLIKGVCVQRREGGGEEGRKEAGSEHSSGCHFPPSETPNMVNFVLKC